MPQVVTMGETMAALAPPAPGALRYAVQYGIRTAGAESNTAVGLAKLGMDAAWFSKLGEDEFGYYIRNQIRSEGVDCSRLLFDPCHRTGVMFKQFSAGETRVFYYRENSAASHLGPEDIAAVLPDLLEGASVLHLSGVTPVLSESCREAVLAALALAKERGVAVSFDPNIRRKLWGTTDYTPLLRDLTLQSEIVLLGLDEAQTLFGVQEPEAAFDILFRRGCARLAAIKDGARGAWVADGKNRLQIPPHPCRPVDPVGAGDGFNAGLLAGYIQGKSLEQAGRMGAVCGALATEVPGDVEGYPDAARLDEILKNADVIYR